MSRAASLSSQPLSGTSGTVVGGGGGTVTAAGSKELDLTFAERASNAPSASAGLEARMVASTSVKCEYTETPFSLGRCRKETASALSDIALGRNGRQNSAGA